MPKSRQPLPDINFRALADALLARAEVLVPLWLPGGHLSGHEYKCADLIGGKGASCSVNLKEGKWGDFATGETGGDLISLYAAIHGLDHGKAAVQVARDEGLEDVAGVQRDPRHQRAAPPPPATPMASQPRKRDDAEGWQPLLDVPADGPAPTFHHWHRRPQDITHKAAYRLDGKLLGYVVRFATSDGGKDVLPYTWCRSDRDGGMAWKWKQWSEPRPLYLPGGAAPGERTVVLVEGEKKADTLHALLEAASPGVYCVASWPGGCKAWNKALWEWLAGSHVLLWPDCDAKRVQLTPTERKAVLAKPPLAKDADEPAREAAEQARKSALDEAQAAKPLLPPERQPGMAAMLGIGRHLVDAHSCTVLLLPIPASGLVKDGWDCGDAIEADGWDAARVLAFFVQAQPLPPPVLSGAADGAAKGKKIERPVDTEAGGSAGADGGGGAELSGPHDTPRWLQPYWDSAKKRWNVSRKLVIRALNEDPLLAGVLGMNELSGDVDARREWPWMHGHAGPIDDNTDLALGLYLSDTYGLPSISRAALMEAIQTVAARQRFHPVREYLRRLEWDGTSRVDKWLIHILGHTPTTLSPAMFEYLTLVGRFWLLGMVNRVMEPGCKFDYCPVLEGPTGQRKSTLPEVLASKEWFSDTHFDVSKGKEGQEQVKGLWMYEISELAGFSRTDIRLIKSFISAKVDRFRPAYARVLGRFPRQCVMVGTTNERSYLRDRTGNRRFWPVPVRQIIDTDWVARWRDQLFAEAFVLYQEGATFAPSPMDEERLFRPMQESRLIDSAVQTELTRLLTREPTGSEMGMLLNQNTTFVTMSDLVRGLGADVAKSNTALEAEVRSWMDHEGWDYTRRRVNGARTMGYLRPKGWPPNDGDDEAPMDAPVSPPPKDPPAGSAGAAEPSTEQHGDADDAPF